MLSKVDRVIYASRLMLIPFYFCLIVALTVYTFSICRETFTLIMNVFSSKVQDESILLHVLTMMDIVMIANLIILILIGSYNTFVKKLGIGTKEIPQCRSFILQ